MTARSKRAAVIRQRRVNTVFVDRKAAMAVVGNLIRDARKKRELTQEELAEACAITRTQLVNVELGRSWLGLDTLVKLIYALDLRLDRRTFA